MYVVKVGVCMVRDGCVWSEGWLCLGVGGKFCVNTHHIDDIVR